jgi:hypothetical protein
VHNVSKDGGKKKDGGGSINESLCQQTIRKPDSWCCEACETSNSIRMCLCCGSCACERHSYAHYEQHRSHTLFLQLNAENKPVYCYECRHLVHEDNEQHMLAHIRSVLEDVQNLNIDILSKSTRSGRKRLDANAAAAAAAAASAAAAACTNAQAATPSADTAAVAADIGSFVSPPPESVKTSWQRVKKWQKVLPFLSKRAQKARRTEDQLRTVLFRWRNRSLTQSFLAWKFTMIMGREDRLKRRAAAAASKKGVAAAAAVGSKRKFADDLPLLSFDLSRVVPEGDEDASDTESSAAAPGGAAAAAEGRTTPSKRRRTTGMMLPPPSSSEKRELRGSAHKSIVDLAPSASPKARGRPKRSRSEERHMPPPSAASAHVSPRASGKVLSATADDLLSPPGSASARRRASASARSSPKISGRASPSVGRGGRERGAASSSATKTAAAAALPKIKLAPGIMGLRNLGNSQLRQQTACVRVLA